MQPGEVTEDRMVQDAETLFAMVFHKHRAPTDRILKNCLTDISAFASATRRRSIPTASLRSFSIPPQWPRSTSARLAGTREDGSSTRSTVQRSTPSRYPVRALGLMPRAAYRLVAGTRFANPRGGYSNVPARSLRYLNGATGMGALPAYRDLAYAAACAASSDFALGSVGAGLGATTATFKGGLGSASAQTEGGVMVGALAVVNAVGSVTVGDGPWFWAAPFEMENEFGGRGLPPSFTKDMLRRGSRAVRTRRLRKTPRWWSWSRMPS